MGDMPRRTARERRIMTATPVVGIRFDDSLDPGDDCNSITSARLKAGHLLHDTTDDATLLGGRSVRIVRCESSLQRVGSLVKVEVGVLQQGFQGLAVHPIHGRTTAVLQTTSHLGETLIKTTIRCDQMPQIGHLDTEGVRGNDVVCEAYRSTQRLQQIAQGGRRVRDPANLQFVVRHDEKTGRKKKLDSA